jgi:hypothetical protein
MRLIDPDREQAHSYRVLWSIGDLWFASIPVGASQLPQGLKAGSGIIDLQQYPPIPAALFCSG